MNIKFLITLITLILLQGCKKNNEHFRANIKPIVKNKIVRCKVLDIECEECALSVENICKSINGVKKSKYIYLGSDFENGILELEISPEENLDLANMKKVLYINGFEFNHFID